MSDKNDKFNTTEDISSDERKKSKGNAGQQTMIYSFLILLTGVGFAIGAIISGLLVGGTLCLFEMMSYFTNNMSSLDTEVDITEMFIDEYTACVYRSPFSPITLILAFIGGFMTGYPSYKIAKKVSSGQKLKTMV